MIEAEVNHQSGRKAGVAGIYDLSDYRAERARAVQEWADFLLEEGRVRVGLLRT